MNGRIYHLNDQGQAMAMEETPYDAECTLQELLAKHPDLLAGDQIDSDEPRRWLLITREMAVASEDDGAERWSLDQLPKNSGWHEGSLRGQGKGGSEPSSSEGGRA